MRYCLLLSHLKKRNKKSMLEQICEVSGGELIQQIGHVAVVFRNNPKSKRFAKILTQHDATACERGFACAGGIVVLVIEAFAAVFDSQQDAAPGRVPKAPR